MSIAELKLELIKKINDLPEDQFIGVHNILSNYLDSDTDFWQKLSKEERAAIEAV